MQSTRLGHYSISYRNSEEFHSLKREIFTQDSYYIDFETTTPKILDAGAHIGLASLYFKKIAPQAEITCLEPLLENCQLLVRNLEENQIRGVKILPFALSDQVGNQTFYFDASSEEWYSTASLHAGAWTNTQTSAARLVPTKKLSDLLKETKYDLVKLDIEGSESAVLQEASDLLQQVPHLLIEYHPQPQTSLKEIMTLLTQKQFASKLYKAGVEIAPHRARGLVLIEAHRQ